MLDDIKMAFVRADYCSSSSPSNTENVSGRCRLADQSPFSAENMKNGSGELKLSETPAVEEISS
eukprot:CAMPEP_0194414382 /NCGR_PEP_ID=MMETSP0176-20130528/13034_1 /TAXON_ID=216777 /ORGANISM="Proboscia alata, Strain PI-D3" /LENGTH=63 /DNA_ID=CAMNT_0039218343 /DNA_START=19 /DNA_END=206 /DNA_ORIENTATION=+